jgi:hypothetical protein
MYRIKSCIITARYDGAPFPQSMSNILLLKNIPHYEVDVRLCVSFMSRLHRFILGIVGPAAA